MKKLHFQHFLHPLHLRKRDPGQLLNRNNEIAGLLHAMIETFFFNKVIKAKWKLEFHL